MREEGKIKCYGELSPSGGGRGRIGVLSILLFSIIFISWKISPDDPGESKTYSIKDYQLEFYDAWECSCYDSCGFTETSEDYFVFNNATHFHGASNFLIRYLGEEGYDSLFVYQRYEYAYGILFSETEGVILLDTARMPSKKQSDLVSYGSWIYRPKNKYGVYDLYHNQKFEGNVVKGPAPKFSKKIAEDSLMNWRVDKYSDKSFEEQKKKFRERKMFGLYINGIELRLKIYHKGRIKRATFYFPFLHGEC